MSQTRDIWDKVQILTTIAGVIAVPVVIAVAGMLINTSLKRSEAELRTVELAINILQQTPDDQNLVPLRNWGCQVLDRYSGVGFGPTECAALMDQPLPSVHYVGDIRIPSDGPQVSEDRVLLMLPGDSYTVYKRTRLEFHGSVDNDLRFTISEVERTDFGDTKFEKNFGLGDYEVKMPENGQVLFFHLVTILGDPFTCVFNFSVLNADRAELTSKCFPTSPYRRMRR